MSRVDHALRRTNPIGEKFVGRCIVCGKENLRIEDLAADPCPNPEGLTEDQIVLKAIESTDEPA